MQRRTFLLTSLLSALLPSTAEATEIDPKQTFLQRDEGKSSGLAAKVPTMAGEA